MNGAGGPAPDQAGVVWSQVVSGILEDARRRAGKGPALAGRLEQAGVGGRGARYSESSISNWIRGRAMPPADVVLAAAKAVGISLDERLGIGREVSQDDRQLEELRELLSQQNERAAALEERLDNLARAVGAVKGSTGGADVESRLDKIEVQIMEILDDLTKRERGARPRRQQGTRREAGQAG